MYAEIKNNQIVFVADYSPVPASAVPVVVDAQPGYDASTQKLVASYVYETTQVRKIWTITPLSQMEANDASDAPQWAAQAQTIFTKLMAGTATSLQIQKALALTMRAVAETKGVILT